MNGIKPRNMTRNWRLAAGLENISTNLTHILALIPLHVRRKANELADSLANDKVILKYRTVDVKCETITTGQLKEDCLRIHRS